MPKSAKNSKPTRTVRRVSLATSNTPPDPRGRLVEAGLLLADGTVVGVTDHLDAKLFQAVVEWREALLESQNACGTSQHLAALSRFAKAEKRLVSRSPKTREGVGVLLDLASKQVEMMPTSCRVIAAAVRAAVTVGV